MESTDGIPPVPVKVKKKKRSFLDDDDFFNMKKPKTKSPAKAPPFVNDSAEAPATSAQAKQEPGSAPVKPEFSPGLQKIYDSEAQHFSSDDNLNYMSANDSFQGPSRTESIVPGLEPFDSFLPAVSGPEMDLNSVNLLQDLDRRLNGGITGFAAEFADLYTPPTDATPSDPVEPDPVQVEEEDIVDSDLKEFFSEIVKNNTTPDDEAGRLYQIKVISRVGPPLEYEKEISGQTTFAQLVEQLSQDTLRDYNNPKYWNSGVLVWIEGRSELKPIFKPSTLRIPRPSEGISTKMTCLFIPVENASNFENLYEEFKIDQDDGKDNSDDELEVLSVGTGDGGYIKTNEDETAKKSEYFIIGLKGKDNKRIEAEVGPATQIRNILKHYMEVKGIAEVPGREYKLIFDDEELDLNATVADTELEEDFEVQVYI